MGKKKKLWACFKKALQGADIDAIRELISSGVDVHHVEKEGYDALIYAACGGEMQNGRNLIDILRLLLDHNVTLSGESSYNETAIRILSRIGRFDAVSLLLNAGSDESELCWTPLIRAVAIGSKADVIEAIKAQSDLEQTDYWSRTAWLVAILRGSIEIASVVRDAGANTDARGRCSQPPILYAIQGNHPAMLQWLIRLGYDVESCDEFGRSGVIEAVELNRLECLRVLVHSGAQVSAGWDGGTPLQLASSRDAVFELLAAGASPADISYAGIRTLIGLAEFDSDQADCILSGVSRKDFASSRTRVFGKSNPTQMTNPYWMAMIQSGASGYLAGEKFRGSGGSIGPNWSAERFGQSFTVLEDGRVILIGGEHEDGYDPDFCIYNDIFVFDAASGIEVYGYPESVFPPTDFHTATLVGDQIFIIGCLGYQEGRKHGYTPVYKLSIKDFRIEMIETFGEMPGWIYNHRTTLAGSMRLRIEGGVIVRESGENESHDDNVCTFELNLNTGRWHKL